MPDLGTILIKILTAHFLSNKAIHHGGASAEQTAEKLYRGQPGAHTIGKGAQSAELLAEGGQRSGNDDANRLRRRAARQPKL
jgi:hypothetical protein